MEKTFKATLVFVFVLCFSLIFIACGKDTQSGDDKSSEKTIKEGKSSNDTGSNNASAKNAGNSDSQESSGDFNFRMFTFKEINGGSEYEISASPYLIMHFISEMADSDEKAMSSKELVIPSDYNGKPVTAIGADAFKDIYMITKVIIPDSVTVIEKSAFSGCSGINSVILGKATIKIGDYAFNGCKSLNSVNIPETLTYLGDFAFRGCSNLQSNIVIPDAVTNSLKRTFSGCSKLTSVTIGKGVPKIEEGAFSASGIISIVIPGNVKSIEDLAFVQCTELTDVIIEDGGVTHIEGGINSGSFRDCSKLKTVVFGNKLEHIGQQAFQKCSGLESITFPASLITINKAAFRWCSSLRDIKFENSAASVGEGAFEYCSKLKNIDFGDSLVRISAWAFKDCTSLTEITLPASLKYLGGLSMPPFMGCNKPIIKVKGLSSAPSGWAGQWKFDCGKIEWGQ